MSDSDLFSESDHEDVLISSTPADNKTKKAVVYNPNRKLINSKSFVHAKRRPMFLVSLRQSFLNLTDKQKPYIVYTLKEIQSFTKFTARDVNKVRAIGIYREDYNLQYLTSEHSIPAKVLLDFTLTEKMPLICEQIQVFGFIDFKQLDTLDRCVPILVVRFWNLVEGDAQEFITTLQIIQQTLALTECSVVEDITSTSNNNATNFDSRFDEVSDSFLNKGAEALEGVYTEFSERLNTSEDLFE